MSAPLNGESALALLGGAPVQCHGFTPVMENVSPFLNMSYVPSDAQPQAPKADFGFLKAEPSPNNP